MKRKWENLLLIFLLLLLAQPPLYAQDQTRDFTTMKHILTPKEKAQLRADDKILQDYFTRNNIKPQKTTSGLYYTITKEGAGNQVAAGDTVSINYTGRFIDGKIFDTNIDTAAHHTYPLTVEIGKQHVVKGMDEGVQLLKKGSRAIIYIPSTLGYGAKDRSNIPANSILIFDMEIADVHAVHAQGYISNLRR